MRVDLGEQSFAVLTVVTPPPGTPEHDAVQLLAGWSAHSDDTTQHAGSPAAPSPRA